MFNPESPPDWSVSRWININQPLSLASLKGRVVVLEAFQMLCPGCVQHGLPQAKRIAERFASAEVQVVGLHTVFEHHKVMTPEALEAFVHEFRWPFPIGVDEPDGDGLPKTMAAYEMQGTPSTLLFDRQGRLRRHYLGQVDDIRLAAEIMALAIEDAKAPREVSVTIERALAAALVEPEQHHHHGHDHEHHHGCGHDHHHDHDHGHGHGHDHGHAHGACGGHGRGKNEDGECCGACHGDHAHEQGHSHDHAHGHAHDHAHGHEHAHGHDHAHEHAPAPVAEKPAKRGRKSPA